MTKFSHLLLDGIQNRLQNSNTANYQLESYKTKVSVSEQCSLMKSEIQLSQDIHVINQPLEKDFSDQQFILKTSTKEKLIKKTRENVRKKGQFDESKFKNRIRNKWRIRAYQKLKNLRTQSTNPNQNTDNSQKMHQQTGNKIIVLSQDQSPLHEENPIEQKFDIQEKQAGFKDLNRRELQTKLKPFELIVKDEFFYGSSTTYKSSCEDLTMKSYSRDSKCMTKQFKSESILLESFKIMSINMDLAPVRKIKTEKDSEMKEIKTYMSSDIESRTRDFIEYLKKAYDDGFDFVFIQEIIMYECRQTLYKALESKELKYFFSESLLPTLLNKAFRKTHLSWGTVVLSRYPVKFGTIDLNFKMEKKGTQRKSSFSLIEFKIRIDGQQKVVKMVSTHLKANQKADFEKESEKVDCQDVRNQEIKYLSSIGQSCDILFCVGDFNIGTTAQYSEGNIKLREKFIDFLDLNCNITKLDADQDGRRYGTFMWREDGKIDMERFDRNLIKVKGESHEDTKRNHFVHVEIDNPELSSCKDKKIDREKMFLSQDDHNWMINLSDHSVVKSLFGFTNLV